MPAPTHGYAIVQHSGYGTAGNPDFMYAVESTGVTKQQCQKVLGAGGVVLSNYREAEEYCHAENYPPEVKGIVPRARGTFSTAGVNDMRIYIPAR